ncbi:MAG: heparan-alpha-glucosaminide N-acetyltransferase domain-containing protein [Candidatus Helarchaeota archaeon]
MSEVRTKKLTRMPRILSIDTLRGLKLTNMLQIHFSNFWVIPFLKAQLDYMSIIYIIGLPLFIIIPGISLSLSIENRKLRGESEIEGRGHIMKRGLLLIIMNQFMNIGAFGFRTSWAGGIFQLLGLSIIITYFLLRWPKLVRAVIAGIIIGISPFLRYFLFDLNDFLGRVGFVEPWSLTEWLKGAFFAPQFFSIFPWLGFVIAGSIIGEYIITGIKEKNMGEQLKKLMKIGVVLFPIGLILDILKFPTLTQSDLNIFNTGNIIWVIGLNCFIIAGFYWLEDIKRVRFIALDLLNLVGRLTLTIFFIHAFFMIAIGAVVGKQMIRMYSFFIIFALFFVFTIVIGEIWKKKNYEYSLEWLLGTLS